MAANDGIKTRQASLPDDGVSCKNLANLSRAGASPANVDYADGNGWVALASAAGRGHVDVVRRLLRSGADPNLADVKGLTALMRAAEGGHGAVADLLLAAKANVEHCDNKGKTALMRAAENRRVEMVERLIKAGADPNHADKRGKTALMRAALGGAGEIVDQLLTSGADPNLVDANGWTALICGTGEVKIVVRLIGAGANIEHAAKDGTTAISRAKATEHGAAVELLEAEVRQRASLG